MRYFYPRSPRGERLAKAWPSISALMSFLSTLPAWGATGLRMNRSRTHCNFYPRSPRGERPIVASSAVRRAVISIHAPRVGSDRKCAAAYGGVRQFLSTLPAWGATRSSGILVISS